MKNYDPNIYRGIHTIKITIQQWGYVGHIIQKMGGNCRGRGILDFDFECDGVDCENDCSLKFDERCDYFQAILKNESGDMLEVGGTAEDFNKMIVKMEILDYVKDKDEY